MTEALTTTELQQRIAAQQEAAIRARSIQTPYDPDGYRFFEPLEQASLEWVEWARTPERRIYTGLPEFDAAMRGIAPKELCLVQGFAHQGKTLFVTQLILNNPHRRIAMFTPDETRVLVLIKLASIIHSVSAEELEQRVQNGNKEAEEMVRSTASECFPRLAVWDESLTIQEMDVALDEFEDYSSAPTELLVYDYVDLLNGAGDDTRARLNTLKAWGKRRDVPFVLLHQTSRTKGSDGQAVTIDSGGYGGEQQSTFVVGVRRKRSYYGARIREIEEKLATLANPGDHLERQLTDARYEFDRHLNSITFNLLKNKRPPGRLVDDVDFHLDPSTGRVEPFRSERAQARNVVDGASWEEHTFDSEGEW